MVAYLLHPTSINTSRSCQATKKKEIYEISISVTKGIPDPHLFNIFMDEYTEYLIQMRKNFNNENRGFIMLVDYAKIKVMKHLEL